MIIKLTIYGCGWGTEVVAGFIFYGRGTKVGAGLVIYGREIKTGVKFIICGRDLKKITGLTIYSCD